MANEPLGTALVFSVLVATNLITWLVVYTYMRDKYVGLLRELASDRRAAEGQTRNITILEDRR